MSGDDDHHAPIADELLATVGLNDHTITPGGPGLLGGASEKEIADRMGLSAHTVHQYVKSIYRAFGVRSRAELMARCLAPASPALTMRTPT